MKPCLVWVAAGALLGACALVQGGTDDKPYKFGFNIEKFQHRLEEKNTKGLIKGEFGFVTGDGVYHETAYATDERGDFKILGMRSYFVGLPGLDLPDITKGSRPVPQKAAPASAPASTPAPAPALQPLDLSGIKGCSGCTIPVASPQSTTGGGASPSAGSGSGGSASPGGSGDPFSRPPSAFGGPGAPPNANGIKQGGPPKPPPYTPVTDAQSNIKVGGFTAEEMKALLYRFNYTLGFHGHHEVGDRAGHKEGGYHFNGRDGFERTVRYTANEFGFQPNITLRELGAESRATPHQDTERGAEFGLKGFEFVWFNARSAPKPKRTVRTVQGRGSGLQR